MRVRREGSRSPSRLTHICRVLLLYCLAYGTMPLPPIGEVPRPGNAAPRSPPAAAPITALFTLRPAIAPMSPPAAAPMPAVCARFGPRLVERGAVDGGSALAVGFDVATTSPPAVVLPDAPPTSEDLVTGWVTGCDTVGESATTLAPVELALRSGCVVVRTGRSTFALATTRGFIVERSRVTRGAAATGACLGAATLSITLPADVRVCGCDSTATRWRASADSVDVGVSERYRQYAVMAASRSPSASLVRPRWYAVDLLVPSRSVARRSIDCASRMSPCISASWALRVSSSA